MSLYDKLAKLFLPDLPGENIVRLREPTRPSVGSREWLDSASELELTKWCCTSLIDELGQTPPVVRPSLETVEDAQEAFTAAAKGLLRRISAVDDARERLEAYTDLALTMEAVLRFGLSAGSPSGDSPRRVLELRRGRGRPKKVTDEAMLEAVFRFMDRHGDFDHSKPIWDKEARLVEAIEDLFDLSHSQSQLRIKKPLEEWRLRKQVDN